MEASRAKEIASSPVMAHVTFHGTPIYIESVDEINESASIHPLNLPKASQEVPLVSLVEH